MNERLGTFGAVFEPVDSMNFVKFLIFFSYMAGEVTRASAETFGSCNLTDFVAEAVGNCEKRFYVDLARDRSVDCRTCYSRMEGCFVQKTRQCLTGHYNEAQLERLINITLLIQRSVGSPQFYCSQKPMNISALDPNLRALITCTDDLFIEGHNCTKHFREIFNTNRNDPSLCQAFSRSRSCTQSVINRYCKTTVPVPTKNRFNPFCYQREPKVHFQTSKRSTNETKTNSKPNEAVPNRAHKVSKVLSRILSVAVGVVNLNTAVRSLGLN